MNVNMVGLDSLLSRVRDGGSELCSHSGRVAKGAIFVSLPKAVPVGPEGPDYAGTETYLADAVHAGAFAIVATPEVFAAARLPEGDAPLSVALVPDTRAALGRLAAVRYGSDTSSLALFGVTGTNGKTTSAYLLEAVFRAAGKIPGVIGTVEYRWPGHTEESPLTTPDCLSLHAMLASMWEAGADTTVMEVSSHALDQSRTAGLRFAGALFTNLTQDHLDYHQDMERYFAAKAKLFMPEDTGGLALPNAALAVNVDDPYGKRIFAANRDVMGFSLHQSGEGVLYGAILEQGPEGLHLRMAFGGETWELFSPLVGEFNAANIMGAQALALAAGLGRESLRALAAFAGVPGRLERITNSRNLSVFVDYAHTPDALQKALLALRGARFSRIITVFGCGGNRDRSKRPLMGEAAAALSDVVVLTSDNPRKEAPEAIMADVRPGLGSARSVILEADRKKAIAAALELLRPGDALLIAGKGHEPYQIIGDIKHPFSDQQVVREYLGCI